MWSSRLLLAIIPGLHLYQPEKEIDTKAIKSIASFSFEEGYYNFDFSFRKMDSKLHDILAERGDFLEYKGNEIVITDYKSKGNRLSLVDFKGDYQEILDLCHYIGYQRGIEDIVVMSQNDAFIDFMMANGDVVKLDEERRNIYLYEAELEA